MSIDVETLSIVQLENLVENHRRKQVTNSPLYVDAIQELEKRKGKGLDFDKSLSIILNAAKSVDFLAIRNSPMRAVLIGARSTTQSESISGAGRV